MSLTDIYDQFWPFPETHGPVALATTGTLRLGITSSVTCSSIHNSGRSESVNWHRRSAYLLTQKQPVTSDDEAVDDGFADLRDYVQQILTGFTC
ncbi:MAG: hypothetical protein R2932_59800 [Caldilineaceae bacterium]